MLPALEANPTIHRYLHTFSRSQWPRCIELTLLYGIHAARKAFPYGITLEALSKEVEAGNREDEVEWDNVRENLSRMREEVDGIDKSFRLESANYFSKAGYGKTDLRSLKDSPILKPATTAKQVYVSDIPKNNEKLFKNVAATPTKSTTQRVSPFATASRSPLIIKDIGRQQDDEDARETRIKRYIPEKMGRNSQRKQDKVSPSPLRSHLYTSTQDSSASSIKTLTPRKSAQGHPATQHLKYSPRAINTHEASDSKKSSAIQSPISNSKTFSSGFTVPARRQAGSAYDFSDRVLKGASALGRFKMNSNRCLALIAKASGA